MGVKLSDIASMTELSVSTVSRAIKNDSRLSPDTIRIVADAVRRLNYRSPAQKRLEVHREKAMRLSDGIVNICLLFPYPFAEYRYTHLDLLIIETLEECVQGMGGALHITRLTRDGRIPDYIMGQEIDGVIMKSFKMPSAESCPLLHQIPLACVFGIDEPNKAQVLSASDSRKCVNIVWEEMIERRSCNRIIVPFPENHGNAELDEKLALLKFKCRGTGVKLVELEIPDDASRTGMIQKAISESAGKPAVFFSRIFPEELSICEDLLRCSLKAGRDYEVITALYDCPRTLNPSACWIDLNGREIIRAAFNRLISIISGENTAPTRLLVQPELLKPASGPECSNGIPA